MEANITLNKITSTERENNVNNGLMATPGIWIGGKIYWLRDSREKLISEENISVIVKERSIHSKTKIHEMFIKNHGEQIRDIKVLFVHHHPEISREVLTFVAPVEKAIFHVMNPLLYLVNGYCQGKMMDQATVQPLWKVNTENIWQSLGRGILQYQPMAKGMMASIFSLDGTIDVNETCKASSWTVMGENKKEALQLNQAIKKALLPI
ncbi:hypothetical protein PZE06_20690 [Robertmurraya sp. DFI.2.37]|uniref:hypothetical protein n=1 Tax=Robertmurraya sp. DFI.2.37 TaxID=3031819 RepID=UPI001246881A|nr:hypothetical protein [Robertmurraya sp. DFI.2.37]MDF1510554.1 hypothetical protein [Robertmurraya sp. DFI.2.37]